MGDLISFLTHFDTVLFVFFNVHLANSFSDVVMPFVTTKQNWYPVWLAAIILLCWKGGAKGRWVVLIVLLAVSTSDLTVNRLFKPLFHRIRPCNVVQNAHLLLGKKSSFSMPSSHATNFFAVATVFSYYYRKYQAIFLFLAALVAYSRIAVGVHYPFDVLVGALLGMLIGYLWTIAFKRLLANKGYRWL